MVFGQIQIAADSESRRLPGWRIISVNLIGPDPINVQVTPRCLRYRLEQIGQSPDGLAQSVTAVATMPADHAIEDPRD